MVQSDFTSTFHQLGLEDKNRSVDQPQGPQRQLGSNNNGWVFSIGSPRFWWAVESEYTNNAAKQERRYDYRLVDCHGARHKNNRKSNSSRRRRKSRQPKAWDTSIWSKKRQWYAMGKQHGRTAKDCTGYLAKCKASGNPLATDPTQLEPLNVTRQFREVSNSATGSMKMACEDCQTLNARCLRADCVFYHRVWRHVSRSASTLHENQERWAPLPGNQVSKVTLSWIHFTLVIV